MFRGRFTLAIVCLSLAAPAAQAGPYISEIYFTSPGGLSIEVTDIDATQGATLVVADAKRTDPLNFSKVLDVFYLTSDTPFPAAKLFSTTAWPAEVPHRTVDQISHLGGNDDWSMGPTGADRLLLLYDGTSPLQIFDNPVFTQLSNDRHDAVPLADYLLLGPAGIDTAFSAGLIDQYNTALGTDLLARTAVRSDDVVLARTYLPGEPIDLDTIYAGQPDELGVFNVGSEYLYLTTPGQDNLPLVNVPEPGSISVLALCLLATANRRRRPV